jgi:urate oxidase
VKTLAAHRYGKSRVRLMKVLRDGPVHTVKELTARVLLEGAFDRCYTAAENTGVIATDTMKNTLNVLAHECLGAENEPFARRVASHFLDRYGAISRVTVTLDERVWSRLQLAGATSGADAGAGTGGHPHTFKQADVARPFTRVVASAGGGVRHESGVRKLILLKSTGSGFEGFHRDDLTTLPETTDRILASSIRATWRWADAAATTPAPAPTPGSYADANRQIVDALIVPFAERYSASVQATLFEMATAALDACPAITQITLTMPNLHCLPIDLRPFGRTNRQELFVPTDEPHGYIEATVRRE